MRVRSVRNNYYIFFIDSRLTNRELIENLEIRILSESCDDFRCCTRCLSFSCFLRSVSIFLSSSILLSFTNLLSFSLERDSATIPSLTVHAKIKNINIIFYNVIHDEGGVFGAITNANKTYEK